jgi:hypothetical protein
MELARRNAATAKGVKMTSVLDAVPANRAKMACVLTSADPVNHAVQMASAWMTVAHAKTARTGHVLTSADPVNHVI